ncbi:hypothetical protein C7S16_1311 [Burkholderia thailandensis]|uniref:Uncharacterized protein n=1 Tax=Burkholderia thailandensis TaxID=57975 RepID=A0AAW9D313_BURTH|nr:hypothetical protein [Burkholderia thailandensis]MDW9256113.1 hypothetical protein [Burkholderia thailandensis]
MVSSENDDGSCLQRRRSIPARQPLLLLTRATAAEFIN